jgi:hypothetical protein
MPVQVAGPVSVQIVKEPAQPFDLRKSLTSTSFLALLTFVAVSLALWFVYDFSARHYVTLDCGTKVTASLTYPGFLATGDEGQLSLTVYNGMTATLTTTVVVAWLGTLPVQVKPEGASAVHVANLLPAAAQGAHLALQIAHTPSWFQSGDVEFVVRRQDTPCRAATGEATQRIHLAPAHALGGYLSWFRLTPLTLLFTTLWEWLKKRLPLLGG